MHGADKNSVDIVDDFMGFPYGLSSREFQFVNEYFIDHHPQLAAMRAGYSKRDAPRLMSMPAVRQAIMDGLEERKHACRMDEERIIKVLSEIAFGDRRDILQWDDNGVSLTSSEDLDYLTSLIVNGAEEKLTKYGTTIKLDMADRLKAIELLAKLRGLLRDRVEHTGKDGGPIETNSNLSPGEAYLAMLKGPAK